MNLVAAAWETPSLQQNRYLSSIGISICPETWPAVVTGIWSEIPEIPCVEITDELLRTTGHMNNFCLREFIFTVFQPITFE